MAEMNLCHSSKFVAIQEGIHNHAYHYNNWKTLKIISFQKRLIKQNSKYFSMQRY